MAGLARREMVDPSEVQVCHAISVCVRKAFLCGEKGVRTLFFIYSRRIQRGQASSMGLCAWRSELRGVRLNFRFSLVEIEDRIWIPPTFHFLGLSRARMFWGPRMPREGVCHLRSVSWG